MLLGALKDSFTTRDLGIVMSSRRGRDINMLSKYYSCIFVLCRGSNTLVLNVPRYKTILIRSVRCFVSTNPRREL